MKNYEKWLEELLEDINDERHGTYTGYRYGCRCFKCRLANAQHSKDYYDSRKGSK